MTDTQHVEVEPQPVQTGGVEADNALYSKLRRKLSRVHPSNQGANFPLRIELTYGEVARLSTAILALSAPTSARSDEALANAVIADAETFIVRNGGILKGYVDSGQHWSRLRSTIWLSITRDRSATPTPVPADGALREASRAALATMRTTFIGCGTRGCTCNLCGRGWLIGETERHAETCQLSILGSALSPDQPRLRARADDEARQGHHSEAAELRARHAQSPGNAAEGGGA